MSHGRLTEIFLQARQLSALERSSFLDRACGEDSDLREALDSLLSHDVELGPTAQLTDGESAPDVPSSERARFLPGTVLAGRYRIVALLGRGGMGEVYRADDLKLDQPVALKFLPQALADDRALLDRMVNEVRLSRQIAHPNVCRVYDVGEAEGLHFFSMEFVDGEDLSTLLRRIGRVPRDKALQIARQIAAGVAAAHELGILHRDLKPANIMIDGRGRAKITDFGLAAIPGKVADRGFACGTPAYMSPEQLVGGQLTVRSDLYALGVVLYELFTGQHPFAGGSMNDGRAAQVPPNPSSVVEGLDPDVEQVILHCLESDSSDRPSSALAILAKLPGADPLSTALMAGETPSPELVAAAEAETGLTAGVGVACLVLVALGLLLLAGLSRNTMLFATQPLELPPEALAYRAEEVLTELGVRGQPGDFAHGFAIDFETLAHQERSQIEPGTGRFPALYFWYRRSPEPLRAEGGSVDLASPAPTTPGMASVVLSPGGQPLEFQAVPRAGTSQGLPDWRAAFRLAGLDLESFRDDTARAVPTVHCDSCPAWIDESGAGEQSAVRVRAGAIGDRLTSFHVLPSWRESLLANTASKPTRARSFRGLWDGLYIVVAIACAMVARRNLQRGRGDKRGATRLALYVFSVTMASGLLFAHHTFDLSSERPLLGDVLGKALVASILLCWIPYVALEPLLRRAWPHRIVSWTRLLAGRLRDPLVGRDLLIGVQAAVVTQLLLRLYVVVPGWLGMAAPRAEVIWPETLLGLRYALGTLLSLQPMAVFFGLALLFLLLAFRTMTRTLWIATPLVVFFVTLALHPEVSPLHPEIGLLVTAVRIGVFVFVMLRFGVLAGIVGMYFDAVLNVFPVTLDSSAWYFEVSLLAAATTVAVAAWGLRHALSARRVAWVHAGHRPQSFR